MAKSQKLRAFFMRLFIALDIDESIRRSIALFMDGTRNFAPDVRWVKAESLHVTLKFIGEKPDTMAEAIRASLSQVTAQPITLSFRGHGFFPTARSPRVFWIGIDAGPQLSTLAAAIEASLAELGVPREQHDFSPHLTLARGGSGSGAPGRRRDDRPNTAFQRLQEKLGAMPAPEFGTMTTREFFLYESRLSPHGAQYTKLQAFPLR
jgi:RNA 2',3'-cyclic 3'-phosphodiesterase